MTTINMLSQVTAINAGDVLPIYQQSSGQPRQVAVSALAAFMSSSVVTSAGVMPPALLTTGAGGVYALNPTTAVTALTVGMGFRVQFNASSSGSNTLNVSGLGAKPLLQYNSSGTLVAPTIVPAQFGDVIFDGTNWIFIDPLPTAASSSAGLPNATATTGGTAGAFVLTPSPAPGSLQVGMSYRVQFNVASSATNTLNVSGFGAKPLMQYTSAGGLTNASFSSGLFSDVMYDGTNWIVMDALPPATGSSTSIKRSARAANIALTTTDNSTLIDFTSGPFTQTFVSNATLGVGWFVFLRNNSGQAITLQPNGGETIDGLSGFIMYPMESRLVISDGASALYSIVIHPFSVTYTGSATFTTPPGYVRFGLLGDGAGGGGGSGQRGATSTLRSGGTGGGGGARIRGEVLASQITSTVTVTIGAAGTGGAAVTVDTTNGNNGTAGGNTTFGSYFTAYGGGAGGRGQGATSSGGAGGGGASSSTGTNGGSPSAATFGGATTASNISTGGAGSTSGGAGSAAEFGGGSGGGQAGTSGLAGGQSVFGNAGGGAGACIDASNVAYNGGAGGAVGTYSTGGGGTAGTSGGSGGNGAAGVNGSAVQGAGGQGGGGGASSVSGSVGNGGQGGSPGGGGGGGAASLNGNNSGAGGNGGGGQLTVWGIV